MPGYSLGVILFALTIAPVWYNIYHIHIHIIFILFCPTSNSFIIGFHLWWIVGKTVSVEPMRWVFFRVKFQFIWRDFQFTLNTGVCNYREKKCENGCIHWFTLLMHESFLAIHTIPTSSFCIYSKRNLQQLIDPSLILSTEELDKSYA